MSARDALCFKPSREKPMPDLIHERRGDIAWITFNRPEARNAVTFAMYEELAAICERANSDPTLRVMVLRGAGEKAFASGTDINQFRAFKTPQDSLDYEARIDRILTALETCRVLRPAHRRAQRPHRLPDRAHAGQLPLEREPLAALGARRPRAHQGPHLHRAPGGSG